MKRVLLYIGILSLLLGCLFIKDDIGAFCFFTIISIMCFIANRKNIYKIFSRPIIKRIFRLRNRSNILLNEIRVLQLEKNELLDFFDKNSDVNIHSIRKMKQEAIVLQSNVENLESSKRELENQNKELERYVKQDDIVYRALEEHREEYNELSKNEKKLKKEICRLEQKLRPLKEKESFIENCNIYYIDSLEGLEFEEYFSQILNSMGYSSYRTQSSGDYGIDVIAEKEGIRYGFQCKLYNQNVGNKAVQEAYSGKAYYNCHVAIVVTNNYFTKGAINQADKNEVVLWDRDKLIEIIESLK